MRTNDPLFKKIDCLQLPVPSLAEGLEFYQDKLGHSVVWRTDTQVGLDLETGEAEIVLQVERPTIEVDLTVEDVPEAVSVIVGAGGRLVIEPFEIPIGRIAVVADPFGNQLVILDNSNGTYEVDDAGRVTSVRR